MSHIFISYSHEDEAVVSRLRSDLLNSGINIWIDKIGLTPGTPDWDDALRNAINRAVAVLLIASPSSRRSLYVRDEIALARAGKKLICPLWVAGKDWIDCVPIGYGSTQHIDLRGDAYPNGLKRLIDVLTGIQYVPPLEQDPTTEIMPPVNPRNPYKGLRAFQEGDKGDFFGRDVLIDELITAIGDGRSIPRLRAVLGASGSGKSSVMMAGVLPKLRSGAVFGSEHWIYLEPIIPGTHPVERLVISLGRELKTKTQAEIRRILDHRGLRGLHDLSCEISDQPIILYIDQFEELFTLTSDEAERRQFIDLLTVAAAEPNGVLCILLTMRADFYDRPAKYSAFGKLIEDHHTLITPMTLADLYDVVKKPAALPDVQLIFDDGLETELVFAVREDASALPLLQFTLDQLAQRRDGQRLTRAAYEDMGRLKGALLGHAEATYKQLPTDAHRELARALFLRLIEPGTTPQETTRRRAQITELELGEESQTEMMDQVIETFLHARLLTADGAGTIEVSHEALIREWERLGEWLRDRQGDIGIMKRVAADAHDWIRKGKPDDLVYSGRRLLDAQEWAARNPTSAVEAAFLAAGAAKAVRDDQFERDRQARELKLAQDAASEALRAKIAEQSRATRFFRAALIAGIFGVAALVAWGIALENTAAARQQVAAAESTLTNVPPTLTDAAQIAAAANYQAATLAVGATYSALEVNRVATLNAGGVGVPVLTQTPTIFHPTLTAIAGLIVHNPSLPENNMPDEYGVAMVYVPPGCFFMGSYNTIEEQPVHEVCFQKGFWIDRTEVTQGDFERLGGLKTDLNAFFGERRPVENITWFEARNFCALRRARLPTEAEWEYAARGPDSLAYPWGNQWNSNNAVDSGNSDNQTADVGSREADVSWVGAVDMAGNVAEWVNSIYGEYPAETSAIQEVDVEPNTENLMVMRGGSWNSSVTANFRASFRNRFKPDYWFTDGGFRCVRLS